MVRVCEAFGIVKGLSSGEAGGNHLGAGLLSPGAPTPIRSRAQCADTPRETRHHADADPRSPAPRLARGTETPRSRRVRRADQRRAHERVCRRLRAAAELADRVRRVGRVRRRHADARGDLRRRALHRAGARPGRRGLVRLPVCPRRRPRRLAEGCVPERRAHRLRSMAAHFKMGVGAGTSRPTSGDRPDADPRQPDRRGVVGPPHPLRSAGNRPSRRSFGAVLRRQARRCRRLAGRTRSRCGRGARARFDRLAAQHQGQRRRAYAGGAFLCRRSRRWQRAAVHRARQGHARAGTPSGQRGHHPPARRVRRRAGRAFWQDRQR